MLQAPLQPLQDNLESQTYETFERDTKKYTAYEEAVVAALLDRVPQAEAATRTTVLMVVGAGRGPLVRASLRASEKTGRKLQVYAVEKNPNAVVTLQNLVISERYAPPYKMYRRCPAIAMKVAATMWGAGLQAQETTDNPK